MGIRAQLTEARQAGTQQCRHDCFCVFSRYENKNKHLELFHVFITEI